MAPKKNNSLSKKNQSESFILLNGRIYTVDTEKDPEWSRHPKEALVVESGVIRFVGSKSDALSRHPNPEREGFVVHDLRGATVLPGFHDVHVHALEAGSKVGGTCQLPEGISPDSREMMRAIREGMKKQKGTEWIMGYGFSLLPMLEYIQKTRMQNSSKDPKSILDKICVDSRKHPLPCIMIEENSHVAWVNSEALKRAGIDRKTPVSTPGGVVIKNQYGEPNGILVENAFNKVLDLALDSQKYPTLPQLDKDGLVWSLRQLSKAGITSICEVPCNWHRGHHEVWERVLKEGKLTCRTVLGFGYDPSMEDERRQIKELRRLYSDNPRSLLRRNLVSLETDGVLISTTGALLEPYEIDYNITRDGENRGMTFLSSPVTPSSPSKLQSSMDTLQSSTSSQRSYTSNDSSPNSSPRQEGDVETRLSKVIRSLQFVDKFGAGYDLDIRANGDRAVRETLGVLQKLRPEFDGRRRHRISGMELVHRDDLDRVRQVGVMANLQLSSDWGLSSDPLFQDLINLVGEKRSANAIPIRDLHLSGTKVTLSSDWDINSKNPLIGIRNAIVRGRQAVDVQTAVEMYTINGAYAMRQEDIVGSITEGKEADIVVLDRNIIKIGHGSKAEGITDVKVLMTFVAGKEVYRNPDT